MHWYDGSISEAVTLSKQRNAIFVVFVEGENDMSTEMANTIDESVVLKRLSDKENFLAVKLRSGSDNYTHFAQIYQFVPVPSLFFIGRNGTPLEVVCAGVQPDNLATRIDRILEEHHKNEPPSVRPSTSAQHLREETVNMIQVESTIPVPIQPQETAPERNTDKLQNKELKRRRSIEDEQTESSSGPPSPKTHKKVQSKTGKEYDVVCDGDVCVRVPKVSATDPGPSQRPNTEQPEGASPTEELEATPSVEEKMERAKELIEIRRREKADKDKEAEKQKEVDRRATGQGVAELKRWQAEQELKQIQEERKREKMQNDLARQRILEQIAQDRLERRARDAPAPAPAPGSASAPAPAPDSPTLRRRATDSTPTGDAVLRARLQFKLPDGSSHTAHFDADGTLASVHRYVVDNLHMSASSFSLWTAFPRRELTDVDATLRGLELAPSAALLVLPRRTATASVASPSQVSLFISYFTQIFMSFILEPTQQFYTWLRQRLFSGNSGPEAEPSPPRDSPNTTGDNRRRGNIHRLPEDRDKAEDDNNTWNGNSTQQM